MDLLPPFFLLAGAVLVLLVALAALPMVLGLVVVPSVLRWNAARVRRDFERLGFEDFEGVLAGELEGVPMKVRHAVDDKGEVLDVVAWGFPAGLELVSDGVGHPQLLTFTTRFVGPARGRVWLSESVQADLDVLVRLGRLEAVGGMLSLSAPLRGAWDAVAMAREVAVLVHKARAQVVVPLDLTLPGLSPDEQLEVLSYAAGRDEVVGSSEARELARGLLDHGGALDEGVQHRCWLQAGDRTGLLQLIGDASQPMWLRRRALDAVQPDDLAIAMAAVVATAEPDLWGKALDLAASSTDPMVVRAMAEGLDAAVLPAWAAQVPELARGLSAFLHRHDGVEGAFTVDRVRDLLDVDRDVVWLAALRVLGTVGTVAEVAELRRREISASGTLRYAIGRAVARIQQRAGGDAGGLALAECGAGDLSLAPQDSLLALPGAPGVSIG